MTVPKTIAYAGLLSTSQVAKQVGVHRSTVWNWIKSGMLPSELHGSFHGVRPMALKRLLSRYDIEALRASTKKRKAASKRRKRNQGKGSKK
jgi:excisionase family DNA binding protein